ncbi:uncharacterized protein G2W53_044715 [Senna tora]|uniref:Uncharacterized protein n=1 Tax=Senna tora TaxID=362788 RepID=A0A834SBT0_9FABA|nr:uncharacterized protein G2W53_044715 [Senna tora]
MAVGKCLVCEPWMLVSEYVIVACNVIIETVMCMKIKVNMSGSEVGIDTQFSKD